MPPPYATLQTCEDIKQSVRAFFAQGSKSANKKYVVGTGVPVAYGKWRKRMLDVDKSSDALPGLRSMLRQPGVSYSDYADMLSKMPVSTSSGNCGEMAVLSALSASRDYHIDRSRIYLGWVHAPGDHAFCLIVPQQIAPSFLNWPSLAGFVHSGSVVADWAICDPWLNVACGVSDYLTKGEQKLNKWAAEGKRISWCLPGQEASSWCSPSGVYKEKLREAPVELEDFS